MQIAELAAVIARHAPNDGEFATAVKGLYVSRKSVVAEPYFTVQWPCFALVAQGAKSLALGAESYRYGVGDYVVVSAELPVSSTVTTASKRVPNLGLGLALNPKRIAAVLDRIDVTPTGRARSISVQRASAELLDATLRLLRLLDRPDEIPALAPLLEEEITYRLLQGPCGARLLHLISSKSGEGKAHKAARWIRANFTEPLRLERLARVSGMSPSALHQHFKVVTGMSPLQYQKQLRLQEARRMLLVEGSDVTTAGLRVGYASPSQFSREYARQFGVSPRQHLRGADGT